MDSRLVTSGMTAVRLRADDGKAMDTRLVTSGMMAVRLRADDGKAMDPRLRYHGDDDH
jgi:hypothetical protein